VEAGRRPTVNISKEIHEDIVLRSEVEHTMGREGGWEPAFDGAVGSLI
jgi:hypothetical protein